MKKELARRKFILGGAVTAGWLAISALWRRLSGVALPDVVGQGPQLTPRAYLPLVVSRFPPVKVVHVYAAAATDWDFATGWYGDCVDQDVVNEMVEQGVMQLTDTTSVADAWGVLLPTYQPGEKIAVKVNLNNAQCGDNDNLIDALIEPVNALIRSLLAAGVWEEDVWIYDAQRSMPSRFYGRRQYTQARFLDNAGCGDAMATFSHGDGSLKVVFPGSALDERWLTDVLSQATYVVNMPILKLHGVHPVTLGFKNHFGSVNRPTGSDGDDPHAYIDPRHGRYRVDFSPLVDIYANSNIAAKTVLTIGDGLFGGPGHSAVPVRWSTFGDDAPNSLFFARDPVAIDCVMCDLLDVEWGLDDAAYDYLQLAEQRGLGLFDRGHPGGAGYARLTYVRVDLEA